MNRRTIFSKYIAEFLGTFFLVFLGCGSMILTELNLLDDHGLVPFVWGGVVAIMIYAFGHISGAHFNPAVTFAFWSIKRISLKDLLGYVISQLLGAILASAMHSLIFKGNHSFGITSLSVGLEIGFLVEVIITFCLMLVITSVATDSRASGDHAAIAIGLTVFLGAFIGGPLTKASMNPARSLAPAIMYKNFDFLWLYFIAPTIGAILGANTYRFLRFLERK